LIEELKQRFNKVVGDLQSDLTAIRTGRASSALVEDFKVPTYGTTMALKELASISIPEPRQILISPWDRNTITDIEKALRTGGFNPVVEESFLRIVLPPLTGEEREKLVREVGEKAEEAKVALRLARREEVGRVEKSKEDKEISEDEEFSQKKQIDDLLENYNRHIEEISLEKKTQLEL